jgi:hypothetical protein
MKINGLSHRRKVVLDIKTVPIALDDPQGASRPFLAGLYASGC